jgi:hypothetical protein
LSLIVAVAARGAGARIFYVLLTIGTGYLLIRSLHVGVELTSEEVAVHGQMRTRRYPWPHVRRARVEPMRTGSPFYASFPTLRSNSISMARKPGIRRNLGEKD